MSDEIKEEVSTEIDKEYYEPGTEYPYDPWRATKSKNGYDCDVLVAGLQKEIRRGHEENACAIAMEMMDTSEELEDFMWKRLKAICVEDVGFGDPLAAILICSLDQMRKTFPRGAEGVLYAIHAVRYMCNCKKDRSNDEMIDYLRWYNVKPVFYDYIYDKHTRVGEKRGRGVKHFYKEAARVEPELETRNRKYYDKVMERLFGKNK